jgi:hypothetical protein
MSKQEKLLKRFITKPKDFTYDELCSMLNGLGYTADNKGKTSGSRVCFVHEETKHVIRLHKPHPANTLKLYQINVIFEELTQRNMI